MLKSLSLDNDSTIFITATDVILVVFFRIHICPNIVCTAILHQSKQVFFFVLIVH